MVFDILCFVYDLAEKGNVFISFQISFQQFIGSDQNIPALCAAYDFPALVGVSGHHFDGKAGGKEGEFILPVKNKGSRRDN